VTSRPPTLLVHDGSPGLGGSITSVGALVPFLRRAGWRVEVAAFQPEGWDREGILPHLLPARGERITGTGYFLREARRAADLVRLCRRLSPHVLLANNGPAANLSTHLAGRVLGLPVLQYVRGPFWESPVSAAALRAAAAVLAVGEECARQVERAGAVVPTRVDEGLDPDRWPSARLPGARDWLWSSSLLAWKGLPLLLEAYRSVGASAPPLQICHASLPDGHPECSPLPAELPGGVTTRRAPADLDAVRARCLVYVHTALRPEPFGRSLLEAMAAGLCPVVPDEGTPGRLVRHLENGITYRAGSAAALTAALRTAAADPVLCARLGERAAAETRGLTSDVAFQPILAALEKVHPVGNGASGPVRTVAIDGSPAAGCSRA
jgi:glycosyltransferase involved in cell wall biosynthesis